MSPWSWRREDGGDDVTRSHEDTKGHGDDGKEPPMDADERRWFCFSSAFIGVYRRLVFNSLGMVGMPCGAYAGRMSALHYGRWPPRFSFSPRFQLLAGRLLLLGPPARGAAEEVFCRRGGGPGGVVRRHFRLDWGVRPGPPCWGRFCWWRSWPPACGVARVAIFDRGGRVRGLSGRGWRRFFRRWGLQVFRRVWRCSRRWGG